MASKRFCESPDWSSDTIKWYMLGNEGTVGRIKNRKPASPGRIFQVDYDHTDKSVDDGIELKSCNKGQIRVKWRPGVFYGLDDDLKDMLITVEDLKDRLRIFEEHAELLLYAKELKVGDKVDVRVPVKRNTGIMQGTVKYIGPKDSKTHGKYFGIQLDSNLDDSVAVNYSWCKGGNCVLVAVNKIQPPLFKKHDSKPKTRRDQKPSGGYTMDEDADVAVKDAAKPPYIMADDDVLVHAMLTSSRKRWVKGKVVFVRGNHLAVNVDSAEGEVLKPWRGVSNDKKVFQNYTRQTAWVDRNYVEILHDKPLHHENSSSSAGPSNKKQSGGTSSETSLANQPLSKGNSDQKYLGHAQKAVSETKHQLADDGQCEKEDEFKVWHKKGNKLNQHKLGSVEMASMPSVTIQDYHRIPSGTNISEEERCTSDTKKSWTTRITNLMSRAGNSDRKSCPGNAQHVLSETKHQLADYGQCEKEEGFKKWHKKGKISIQHKPGTVKMPSMPSGSDHRIPSGTNIREEEGCTSDTKKTWPTRTNVKLRTDPPPFPFSGYEVQAIVADSKLCHGLISELELTDKWRASTKKEHKDFFRLESVLQSWWKDIHEGHHAHLQRFLMFLGQYGREDIRDHIEKVPDRGCFDETVLNTVILSVTNSWKLFAAELGVKQHELIGKLKQDMNPNDCLKTVFDIWNTNEKRCNKLGQLLKACRAIGRDTLADEIEQGLNELVLRRIGHQIETKQLRLLGEKLLISEVRQDAFRETFQLLPERVYRMFSYWSMLQSFDANKIDMLASVLYDMGLGHVAEKELYKGLRQHELENTAALLSDNWQKLAPVLVKTQDIDYIMEQKGDSSQNCFRMLNIWRGRQIRADVVNLKETLFQAICDLNREARQLYYGPPPYPFSDFHIEVITYDKKLCQGLIRGLQLENKWKAEKGREAFFRLEYVLQHWWTQIYEESKTQMQEFKILLVQYGREDLRDHIDKVPDRGMFDDTILNTAIFLARKDWRKFASELGMKQSDIDEKLKQDVLPDESLRIVFHVWYKQEQGCSKLSKLVKACRSIGQHTLAEEIEQGLSEVMLRKIANQIELKSWQRLADHLLISPVRQDAFREKFKSLPNRVYHMLTYWSMIQPFGTDKVDGLASALYDVKLGYVAQTLLYRDFGGKDCEPVTGYVDPPKNVGHDRVGMFKGIQGVHNSSYMDAIFFSMFAYNSVFHAILFHDEANKEDITQVKDVLRTTIVNPLRSIGYVRADYMLYFCDLLRGLDILQGLQAEEKDPAEFIHALLQKLMNVKPFLQISQGQNTTMESFMYQIFLDKQDNSDTSTVSDLLHLSFLQADLKLAKVPECLIIQLHKYGKKYKLYDWIIPSLEMDINALIRDSPRECSDCGKLALIECKDCTPVEANEDRDVIQSFCKDCYVTRHGKKKHKITNLSVPPEVTKMFQEIAEKVDEDDIAEKTQHLYPEHRMELFSVVCIETSHYVAFVKTGSGDGEQWVFFDSMADRQGDQHGYNIPEVAHLKNFRQQMESDSLRRDMKRHDFSKYLKRLLSDAYICFYRPVKERTSSNMDTNSQTTHVRSAQGNRGPYSESNQILQPHHSLSLGHTDSPYQKTFNQEPTSQQVPQKRNSNQRIEPEERRVMSQGFGDRDLSRGQQHDNPMYDQVANSSTDKGTHQNTTCADEITDENSMDWEPSENREKCNSSQQSGYPSNYSTDQHGQNSGNLKDRGIDQQPRNYKSNQNIGQLRNYNSDQHSSHLSPDTSYTGVNQLGRRSDNIRSPGVSTKHEYENLKDQRSNNDLKTSQQQTSTYPTSTNPPNLPARNKRRNEQQDERRTQSTTPGKSSTSNQDSPGSSTNYRKAALPHSQRDGLEAHMTQNINPQCDSMSQHASLHRDQAGSSKGNRLITPNHIKSQNLPGNQIKGEMKKNSEGDRSGSSHYSELRIDSSVSDDMDISSFHVVRPDETSLEIHK